MKLVDALRIIEESAPGLRTAGVLYLEIGTIKVNLAAPNPGLYAVDILPAPRGEVRAQDEETDDVFNDPELYGLPKGSKVPGYEIDPEPDLEDRQS